jgi:protein SCO1/2
MQKFIIWIGLGSLVLIVALAAILTYLNPDRLKYHGSVIVPPVPAANFTLTNQSGSPGSLADFRGKYVLLFFGFTNCPDECPATMGMLMVAHDQLGSQQDRVQVVFISTDPDRDTPPQVTDFINRFNRMFVGFTGDKAQLQPVWKDFGVTVLDNGETHSTIVYLIDPQGNLRLTYSSSTKPEDIVADLKRLFKER